MLVVFVVLLTGWKLDGEGEGREVPENPRVPDLVQAINAAAGLTIKIRLLDLPGRQHTNYTDKLVYPVITLVATLQHPLGPRRCSEHDYLFNRRRAPVIYDRFCFYRFLQTNIIDVEWGQDEIFHSSRLWHGQRRFLVTIQTAASTGAAFAEHLSTEESLVFRRQ